MQDEKEMRQVYCDCLLELAEKDKNIVVIEADLMNCIKTERFKAAFPERFFNVGIAEANMVGIAAGLPPAARSPSSPRSLPSPRADVTIRSSSPWLTASKTSR